ncbi:MAG: PHP domain-containing protein [Bacteroidota bacterium]
MTNKEIAQAFQQLGQLMHLHGENQFKIRSYENAYRKLRSWEQPLGELSDEDLAAIPGVGKAIHGKIKELVQKGEMATLERYRSQTPPGVQEMLGIKGFGAKKIKQLWQELGVESIGELLYAVNENRLVELKGFGAKTQEDLRQKLLFYQNNQGYFRYGQIEAAAKNLLHQVKQLTQDQPVAFTGDFRRRAIVLDRIDILVVASESLREQLGQHFSAEKVNENELRFRLEQPTIPVHLHFCEAENWGKRQIELTGSDAFVASLDLETLNDQTTATEEAAFATLDKAFVLPERREQAHADHLTNTNLITQSDLKGVLHVHTTASDGTHTLVQMCERARDLGYEYIGITDHSKSAFYASGLHLSDLQKQWTEIDALNNGMQPFRIFKSIESDILNDGSLDYEEDILKQFDFVIASVHAQLKMDEAKATHRLITAIENPYTSILGHPTGRLLLSRKAYSIDHQKVIDACAANGVAIELNANPYRLDLDWKWIPYALEKGVKIAINPDAHSMQGLEDTHFGVLAARKGGLTLEGCLNGLSLAEFGNWCGCR